MACVASLQVLLHPYPLPEFAPGGALAVHKDADTEDLRCKPGGGYEGGVEEHNGEGYLPAGDAERYARNHHDRRGEGHDRGPEGEGGVGVVEDRHHNNHREDDG